jgi:hypothetical protein
VTETSFRVVRSPLGISLKSFFHSPTSITRQLYPQSKSRLLYVISTSLSCFCNPFSHPVLPFNDRSIDSSKSTQCDLGVPISISSTLVPIRSSCLLLTSSSSSSRHYLFFYVIPIINYRHNNHALRHDSSSPSLYSSYHQVLPCRIICLTLNCVFCLVV